MLGIAPFVARKALDQSRRLGSPRLAESIQLLAGADLDVRGARGLAADLVVEMLVARLARQTRPARDVPAREPAPGAEANAPAARRTTTGGSRDPAPYSRRP